MRPTSSKGLFRDVDGDAHTVGRARGPRDLAHRLDDAAPLADDATQIAGACVYEQRHRVAPLRCVDEHAVGVVDQVPGDQLDGVARTRTFDPVALACNFVFENVVLE